jgi:hypothetical protein
MFLEFIAIINIISVSVRETWYFTGARCTALCDKGRWFSPGPPVSSTNKSDRHDIAEILIKVALNTTKQTNYKRRHYLLRRKWFPSTWRKPPTCRKSLTSFITYWFELAVVCHHDLSVDTVILSVSGIIVFLWLFSWSKYPLLCEVRELLHHTVGRHYTLSLRNRVMVFILWLRSYSS